MLNRVFIFAVLCAGFASALRGHAADGKPLPADDVRQAIAVAKLAAKNRMPELSLRAARSALVNGPALQPLSIQIGGLTPSPHSARNADQTTYQQQMNEIHDALAELSAEWSTQQFDPVKVYDTLAAIVCPESRPNEIFLYVRAADDTRTRPSPAASTPPTNSPGSVGGLLVDWAIRAERSRALADLIQTRSTTARGKFEGWVLITELAVRQNDWDAVNQRLGDLQSPEMKLAQGTASGQESAVARIALAAIAKPVTKERAIAALETVANSRITSPNDPNPSLEPHQSWRRVAAIARLQINDVDGARRGFDAMLKASDAFYTRYSGDYPFRMRKQLLEQLAKDLLQNRQPIEAFRMIGEHTELQQFDASSVPIPVASMARQLGQMTVAARYEFLSKWTFAQKPGGFVRMISGFLPVARPPVEFAREPSGLEFPRSTPHPHLFHTGALLIADAAECGKLDELKATVKSYLDAKSSQVDVLDRLLRFRDSDLKGLSADLEARPQPEPSQPSGITKQLQALLPDLETRAEKTEKTGGVTVDDFVLGVFAAQHPETRAAGEKLMLKAIETSFRATDRRTRLRAVYADVLRKTAAESGDHADKPWPTIADWRPVGLGTADSLQNGASANRFLAVDGIARPVATESESTLVYRYPLAGDFEIHTTVGDETGSGGGVRFGGYLAYLSRPQGVRIFVPGRTQTFSAPGSMLRDAASDNDVCWRARDGKLALIVNGQTVFQDLPAGSALPFLGLRGNSSFMSFYRQCRITGKPTIPREVPMLDDEPLLGWFTGFYQETGPNLQIRGATTTTSNPSAGEPDWRIVDGVLEGRRREMPGLDTAALTSTASLPTTESLLCYGRPLWDGEQIRYEFYHEAGQATVHPALDRLAFVIQPEGVKLHWLTEGVNDWTGLSATNLADDPAGQLAAGKVPLRDRDWNTLVVTVRDGQVELSLNETPIYQRRLAVDAERRFALYHNRVTEAARVRKMILTGDWPETLPQGSLFPAEPQLSPDTQRLAAAFLREDVVAKDALFVLRSSRPLAPEKRYAALKRWVMPTGREVALRLHSELVSTDDPLATGPEPHVVAPALDLIVTAWELNRLQELRDEVAHLPIEGSLYNRRARLAMLTLIDLSQKQTTGIYEQLKLILPLLNEVKSKLEWECSPEVLLASQMLADTSLRDSALLMLDWIVEQQIQQDQSGGARFDQRVRALRGTARSLALTGADFGARATAGTSQWIPVTHVRAETRAWGIPEAPWMRTPEGMRKLFGSDEDFLFFRSPLMGDFEVHAEISTFGYREMQIMYAGRRLGPHSSKIELTLGDFTTPLANRKLPQGYAVAGGWTPIRLVVIDKRMTLEINGTKVYEENTPETGDPWLAFASGRQSNGEVRRVRILGNPTIPKELSLIPPQGLHGWSAAFFQANVTPGNNRAAWVRNGDEIVGSHQTDLPAPGAESLLRYHRPLAEDGELTYRFRYRPDAQHVHPAIGETVFLLKPDGVALHPLTNGSAELGGRSPTNSQPLEGTGPLPLKADEENEVVLTLRGDEVAISLNGTSVAKHTLSNTNNRLFGFFHRSGESEAHITAVKYRGDWPQQLPALENQEFARVEAALRDTALQQQPVLFHHDFARDGLPKERFTPRGDANLVQVTADGVITKVIGGEGYRETGLTVRHGITADCDVTVDYAIRHVDELPVTLTDASVGLSLDFMLNSSLAGMSRIGRRIKPGDVQVFEAVHSFVGLDGKKAYPGRDLPATAREGSLRAARRGRVIHLFVREPGDAEWRYVETTALGSAEVPLSSLNLIACSINARDKQIEVAWKSLTIRGADAR